MGSEASEEVMPLLKELAVLREQDQDYEANPTEAEREECRLRKQRRGEITREIKSLAEQKKNSEQATSI